MIDFLLSIDATTWLLLVAIFSAAFLCILHINPLDSDIEQAAYLRQVAANKLAKGRK